MGKNTDRTSKLSALIRDRLEALQLNANAASMQAGLERTAIRDIYRGSVPGATKLAALSHILDIPTAHLLAALEAHPTAPAQNYLGRASSLDQNYLGSFDAGPHDLPLVRQEIDTMGYVPADAIVATIARPAALSGRPGAYAVYISDSLNAPLLQPGSIAYVDPSRPLQLDRPARVTPHSGAAFIGTLLRHDGMCVVLRVQAEAQPRHLTRGDIARIERVVGFSMLDE